MGSISPPPQINAIVIGAESALQRMDSWELQKFLLQLRRYVEDLQEASESVSIVTQELIEQLEALQNQVNNLEGNVTNIETNITQLQTVSLSITAASSDWIFSHNLNKIPSVRTLNDAGEEIFGAVTYPSLNTVRVQFSVPLTGIIYCN